MPKPFKELRAFAKTAVLEPGKEEVVKMHVKKEDLASYDNKALKWTVDKGNYQFMAAASSNDIKLKQNIDIE